MTREEAIKDFEYENSVKATIIDRNKDADMSGFKAIIERNNLAIEALKGGWIPVKNGYPEELKDDDGYVYPSDYVLTFDGHGMYGTSRYWGNRISKAERPDDYLDWMATFTRTL